MYELVVIKKKKDIYKYISKKERKDMKYATNYRVATWWLKPSLILCNDIAKVDENLEYRFELYDEESDTYLDIYQYYLTSLSLDDVEYLEEHFGLLFAYSDKLDLFVLCVDHYGTDWSYVSCETDLEQAQAELGETK